MSAPQFTEATIKLEDTSDNVTEIQSYLEGFQKEIVGENVQAVPEEDTEGDNEEGTYFVDQTGQYYYQAKGESQPVMTVVPGLTEGQEESEEFIINHDTEAEENEEAEEVSLPPKSH